MKLNLYVGGFTTLHQPENRFCENWRPENHRGNGTSTMYYVHIIFPAIVNISPYHHHC